MSYNKEVFENLHAPNVLVMYKLGMVLGIVLNWLGKYHYKMRVVLQIS